MVKGRGVLWLPPPASRARDMPRSMDRRQREHSRNELLQKDIRLHEHGEVTASFDGDKRFAGRPQRIQKTTSEARRRGEVLGALDHEDRQSKRLPARRRASRNSPTSSKAARGRKTPSESPVRE
jgi:hypothetical protein